VNAFDLSKKYPAIFDAVVCLGSTMGNQKDRLGIIIQAKSVLRPDGIMLFSVYSEHARDAQREWYSSIDLAVSDRTDDTLNVEDQISKRFTMQELEQLAKQAGMEIAIEPLTEIGYMAILKNK
jgi:SAM-dependent methyltransferase